MTSKAYWVNASSATGRTAPSETSPMPGGKVVLFVRDPSTSVSTGFKSLNALIGEYEADEDFRQDIEDARKSLAAELFGDRPGGLAELRLSRGMSQARLAALSNTSQPHIARIEAGRNDPTTDLIKRISDALGCDCSDVFNAVRNCIERAQ